MLMHSLRKPLGRNADGVTAYLINRPLSLIMSRRLVSTAVTPNQITTIGLVMGLAAAALAATGTWVWLVLAGFLLQFSSILDGVDGELARLRLTTSVSGEWFDTICDDVINLSFMFALGLASSTRLHASWPTIMASFSSIFGALLIASMYRDLIKAGIASHNNLEWGFEKEEKRTPLTWILIGFSYIAKRDSYNLLMALLLLFDLPVLAFMIMAIAINLIALGFIKQKATEYFGRSDSA